MKPARRRPLMWGVTAAVIVAVVITGVVVYRQATPGPVRPAASAILPAACKRNFQPRQTLFTTDAAGLQCSRAAADRGDAATLQLLARLRDQAAAILPEPVRTVTDKAAKLESNQELAVIAKHLPEFKTNDYLSLSDYYWPDPSQPDGVPYVRRDGKVNPVTREVPDRTNLEALIKHSNILATAYYLTGDKAYAKKTGEYLRAWFVNPATRMNPSLNYAQIKVGEAVGYGVIDAHNLPQVLDALTLIRDAGVMSPGDTAKVKAWFKSYLSWLTSSQPGRHEGELSDYPNNRGTWYRAQVAAIAAYLGNRTVADDFIRQGESLAASQIKPGGSQPLELERADPWNYSCLNLQALLRLGWAARAMGNDLLGGPSGRNIQQGLEYLTPYLKAPDTWPPSPYEQSAALRPELINLPLAMAAPVFTGSQAILRARAQVSPDPAIALQFPPA